MFSVMIWLQFYMQRMWNICIFSTFYPHPLKFLPPDTILYLALPRVEPKQSVFYFCRIITKDFLAAESIYRLEFVIPT